VPVLLQTDTAEAMDLAKKLAAAAERAGAEVLIDDRVERPGVKFKDADLVGIPLRVTIGAKGLAKNCFELRWRSDGRVDEIAVAAAAEKIQEIVSDPLQA